MTAKTRPTLTPFKAIVQIVGAHKDEEGEIVGEVSLEQPLVIYKKDFDKLGEKVDDLWQEQAIEARYFSPNGSQ